MKLLGGPILRDMRLPAAAAPYNGTYRTVIDEKADPAALQMSHYDSQQKEI